MNEYRTAMDDTLYIVDLIRQLNDRQLWSLLVIFGATDVTSLTGWPSIPERQEPPPDAQDR